MKMSYKELVFGKIAIKNQLATPEQIEECLKIQAELEQKNQSKPLGEIMIEKGFLTLDQVQQILKAQSQTTIIQKNYLFGIIAIQNQFATKDQVLECLRIQKSHNPPRKLGKIMLEKGYLDECQVAAILKVQNRIMQEVMGNMDLMAEIEKLKQKAAENRLIQADEKGRDQSEKVQNQKNRGLTREDSPKSITHFIGNLAVRKGLLSLEQLESCLNEYESAKNENEEISLLDIFEQNNFLSKEDIEILQQEVMIQNPHKDLIANYEILQKIGMGAMGVVYKAKDISGQIVALKVLLPKYSNDQKFYKRFMREGYIATTLNHPNLVKAYEVGISEDLVYFSMEYVEGKTVKQILDEKNSIPPKFALFIVGEIAKALECAWKNNLVHRDVKPDNIILTKAGNVKLCDLGIAKEVQPQKPEFTPTDKIMGTPYYVSPELVRGEAEIDIRSDIYSLGATLY
ncbi:MAG: serine/threonine protein kinase, partial [Planctomycetota bacterium]